MAPLVAALLIAPATGLAQPRDGTRRDEAHDAAGGAAELSPDELQAWRALAHVRFVTGDVKGALDALNVVGEPRVEHVRFDGLLRTDREIADEYLGLKPGDLLTAGRLTRLERRLQELPVASKGAVRYDHADGSASVRPIVRERDPFPERAADWVPVGLQAGLVKEIRVTISDPTGRAESWTPSFRWSENRPRAMLQVAAPAPGRVPGILQLETLWERQAYWRPSPGGGMFREERVRAGLSLSDWQTAWLRWRGGAGIERIGSTTYVGVDGGAITRSFDDRVAAFLNAHWYTSPDGRSFAQGELAVALRSTPRRDVPAVSAMAGIAVAGSETPLPLWPAATSGSERQALLRAHPLHEDGVVASDVFGRQLLFATGEYVRPISTPLGLVGIAGFVDLAQARHRLDSTMPSRLHVDVGGGIRFLTSRSGDAVRVDVGYGLRDGRVHVSAGYIHPWGRQQ